MNREILEKPFTPEQIKRRQGTNGDVLDYIEGCTVIQRLNECFDAEWISTLACSETRSTGFNSPNCSSSSRFRKLRL